MAELTRRDLLRGVACTMGLSASAMSGWFALPLPAVDGRGQNGVVLASELDRDARQRLTQSSLASGVLAPGRVALGLYRPSFPDDLSAVDEHDQATESSLRIVHWYALWGGWKRDFSSVDLHRVQSRGAMPMITWEPWAGRDDDPDWSLESAVLSGANDAYIESWAKGLADFGGPVLLRFAHEMHDRPYPWAVGVNGNSADQYVRAWHHVRAIFDRYPTSNVQWVWNPNSRGDLIAADYDPLYRSLYPGDDRVDWLGIDIYNTGPRLNWGAPYWRSFADILAEPYEALTKISDKPILLPEVGCAEAGGSKATWIRDAIQVNMAERFPRVTALVWFDVMKEEQWALDSSSQSKQAWRAAARAHMNPR